MGERRELWAAEEEAKRRRPPTPIYCRQFCGRVQPHLLARKGGVGSSKRATKMQLGHFTRTAGGQDRVPAWGRGKVATLALRRRPWLAGRRRPLSVGSSGRRSCVCYTIIKPPPPPAAAALLCCLPAPITANSQKDARFRRRLAAFAGPARLGK